MKNPTIETGKSCSNCGGYCPSGVLESGKCSECDLEGKWMTVSWGKFGAERVKVSRVTRSRTIYAQRWNRKRGRLTTPRKIIYHRGAYTLA